MDKAPKTQSHTYMAEETSRPNTGGRPPLPDGERRDCTVKVNFDRSNYNKLCRISKKEGVSLSSIVYQMTVEGHYIARLSDEQTDCIRKLAGMSNNLNQLTHLAHIHGILSMEKSLKNLAMRIDETLILISQ